MASDSTFRVPDVPDVPVVPVAPVVRIGPSLLARLYEQSQAARWELSLDQFRATLEASAAHASPGRVPAQAFDRYLASLHLEDLALASACAMGLEPAWNHFVSEHRAALYRAADAIDPSGAARELADALYGDLFGVRERDGVRQSLFRYFHGRSRLTTWLRAVLAQRHIDRRRAERGHDPLPDDEATLPARLDEAQTDPERPRFLAAMRTALGAAIAGLAPRDRLRLRCYYTQELKLAAIGRMLGEHEGTVSRHLTRTRLAVREAVEQHLRRRHGFNQAAIDECFSAVLDDAGSFDLAKMIDSEPGAGAAQTERKPGARTTGGIVQDK